MNRNGISIFFYPLPQREDIAAHRRKQEKMKNFREIRNEFLDYFKKQDHRIVESSSLVPRDDPTLLFTNAGMVQFKGAFLGEDNLGYTRAATSQKCVRAGGKHNDLENVGYTPRHHTFFEMLGNFSFGDYFKEEAILWSWELLTEIYKLPAEKLHISIYKDDDEAYDIWRDTIGVPAERIVRLGEKDNFWSMGDTGPCGPCSEIHIDQGEEMGCGEAECAPGCDCNRFLEIWNLVFTQFDRSADGTLTPLPKPNIDTGMGLERITAVIQGVTSNYDTDLFKGIIGFIEEISGKKYGDQAKQDVAFRVISDHARAVSFMISDGIMPSNEGRGYVLRRIIRRAIRFGQSLELKGLFLRGVCNRVIEVMGPDYGELDRSQSLIEGLVESEEKRFADTMTYSMKVLDDEIRTLKAKGRETIPGDLAFRLYDTYGLSVDIVEDVARDENMTIEMAGYETAMSKQRLLSQESWKGSGEEEIPAVFRALLAKDLTPRFLGYDGLDVEAKVISLISDGKEVASVEPGMAAQVVLDQTTFYAEAGGQAGDTGQLGNGSAVFTVTNTVRYGRGLIVHQGVLEEGRISTDDNIAAQVAFESRAATARNHSATHLLHAALREVLGDHVKQAGSLVTPERFRFDFSHFTQVTTEKILEIERIVNKHIRQNLEIRTSVMSKEEAMKTGAMAIFEEKYGDTVRVVQIGDGVSMELCGGTHTGRTGDIGLFRICGESAVAANMRRIEAVTGETALLYDQDKENHLKNAAMLLKTSPEKTVERIEKILKELKEKDKEILVLKAKVLSGKSEDFLENVREVEGIQVIAKKLKVESPKELREWGDRIKDRLKSGIILLGAEAGGRAILTCLVTKDLQGRYHAGNIIKRLSAIVGGKGGGKSHMAQGGGNQPENLEKAMEELDGIIRDAIL